MTQVTLETLNPKDTVKVTFPDSLYFNKTGTVVAAIPDENGLLDQWYKVQFVFLSFPQTGFLNNTDDRVFHRSHLAKL